MKILVNNNQIQFIGSICEFGYWEDESNRQKWKIEENFYALDDNYTAYDVDEFPADFAYGKYLFVDGEFIRNPDWVEPPKSDSERIAELEKENIKLNEAINNIWDDIAASIEEGVNEV